MQFRKYDISSPPMEPSKRALSWVWEQHDQQTNSNSEPKRWQDQKKARAQKANSCVFEHHIGSNYLAPDDISQMLVWFFPASAWHPTLPLRLDFCTHLAPKLKLFITHIRIPSYISYEIMRLITHIRTMTFLHNGTVTTSISMRASNLRGQTVSRFLCTVLPSICFDILDCQL